MQNIIDFQDYAVFFIIIKNYLKNKTIYLCARYKREIYLFTLKNLSEKALAQLTNTKKFRI